MSRKDKKRKEQEVSSSNRRSIRRTVPLEQSRFDIGSKLNQAAHYHQSGRLQEAKKTYEEILEIRPNHAESLHLLGLIAYQSGDSEKAMGLVTEAIQNDPENPIYYNDLGNMFEDGGKFGEAVSCYQKAIDAAPGFAQPYNNMGVALANQGKFDEAVSWYEKAVQLNPDSSAAHNNMGAAFEHQGKFAKAISCCEKALQLNPRFPGAYNNMGNAFRGQGKLDEAIASYQKALELKPNFASAYNNMGNALRDKGRQDEAISCYQQAIRLRPDYVMAYDNMGKVFQDLGRFDKAIYCFDKALELRPDYAEAHYSMGTVLQNQAKLGEAISCYQKALELRPEHPEAHNRMGIAFETQGKLDEAVSCFQKVLQIRSDPGIEVRMSLLLPVICESKESIKQCRRRMIKQIELLRSAGLRLKDPYEQVGSANVYLAYQGLNDKEIQKKMASFYIEACPGLVATSCNHCDQQPKDRSIKLGLISKYLYGHTIGNLNLGIIENLSRDRFRVKLFRFPGKEKEDRVSKAINRAADEVVILPTDFALARQIVAEHSLDILFYLDVGMDPLTYFLAFSRLAPVQCTTWGHPVTTGIPNMDYFISSENAEPPGAQDHYSERLILLRRLGVHYYRPRLPEKVLSRAEYDLPKDLNLYVCPQSLFKFHPDFDDVLGAILRQDRSGLLVLIEGMHRHWTELLRERFARAFPDAVDRVRFLPRMSGDDFLSLLIAADVLLDTMHFGGGKTSLEAFAFGVPVVTLPGRFLRGRLTLALYRQMGVMDCVADDTASYVNIAVRLANDKTWRDEIKGKIRARADVLYEDIEAVRELERFFQWAVQQEER